MKYKLVCIDMDGTLLNSNHQITENTKKVLNKAHDLGVHIVISTGRTYTSAEYYSNLLGVKSAVIALNGSYIKDKDIEEPIFIGAFEENLYMKIVDICTKNKIGMTFSTEKKFYNGSWMMRFLSLFFDMKKFDQSKIEKQEVFWKRQWKKIYTKENGKIIKCQIMSKNKNKMRKIRDELEKLGELEVVSSYKNNLEITRKGANKGNAVETIAKYYNIKREEIITMGDSENDLSMIEYAGMGIAMGNAMNIVKEKANYITETNDNEGVAKAIEKFILK